MAQYILQNIERLSATTNVVGGGDVYCVFSFRRPFYELKFPGPISVWGYGTLNIYLLWGNEWET